MLKNTITHFLKDFRELFVDPEIKLSLYVIRKANIPPGSIINTCVCLSKPSICKCPDVFSDILHVTNELTGYPLCSSFGFSSSSLLHFLNDSIMWNATGITTAGIRTISFFDCDILYTPKISKLDLNSK